MAVYFVTGKLGAGKSLAAVGRIREYLQQGRRVATNLDLYPEKMLKAGARRVDITRLPDKPRVEHLDALGPGDPEAAGEDEYSEERFGLLVLDELGSWFNSRSWNDKGRADVIEWFLHARKRGWDVLFLVQDLDAVDKQLRGSLCEHLVICRRLDRLPIPLVGALAKVVGLRVTLPRVHVGTVYYGDSAAGFKVDRWWYRGRDLYSAYRTKQVFTGGQELLAGRMVDMRASYSLLTPWHLVGRYERRARRWWPGSVTACFCLPALVYARVMATFRGRSPREVAIRAGLVPSPLALAIRKRAARRRSNGSRVLGGSSATASV